MTGASHDARSCRRGDPLINAPARRSDPGRQERSNSSPTQEAGSGMECTDWLDEGLDSACARFLMLTAITHHQFSSPIWGEHEVRKLHAELAELDALATWAVIDHSVSQPDG